LLRKSKAVEQKPLTDAEATTLLRAGKEEGLKYFFSQYDTALTYFALRITGDEAAAEDIATDAFVKLWENCHKLPPASTVKAYLYRMVRNASVDWLRRRKVERSHQKELIYLNEIAEQSVYAIEIDTKTHHAVFQAIEYLPPRMGQVFRMFYFQRKSLPQIAAELKLSVNTVRNQKMQALMFLRKTVATTVLLLLYFFR
jgi:RNA polymerase sigma-70 factor (family 1)